MSGDIAGGGVRIARSGMHTPSAISWSDVRANLSFLLTDELVTPAAFCIAPRGKELWRWACRQGAALGADGRMVGPSPWMTFVRGATARSVRQVLPAWICHTPLPAVSASEFAQVVLNDPVEFRRCRIGVLIADHMEQHPSDWRYLHEVAEHLRPDAREVDDDREDAIAQRPRQALLGRSGARSLPHPIAGASSIPVDGPPISTRPTLRGSNGATEPRRVQHEGSPTSQPPRSWRDWKGHAHDK